MPLSIHYPIRTLVEVCTLKSVLEIELQWDILQARSQTFLWGGGQIGQILGPFMITRGLSCDRVEFGHFGGGVRGVVRWPPWPPPGYGPVLVGMIHSRPYKSSFITFWIMMITVIQKYNLLQSNCKLEVIKCNIMLCYIPKDQNWQTSIVNKSHTGTLSVEKKAMQEWKERRDNSMSNGP